MNFFECMEFGRAQELIDARLAGSVVGSEAVELLLALGRVTAEEIRAREDLPPFSRSSVDGYAVRSADTFGANESAPALLEIIGAIEMGQSANGEIVSGTAAAIPTGGMLPAGADAVVMLEYAEQPDGQSLLVQRMVAPHENVITRGEDVTAGTVIVRAGLRLTSRHIGMLAASGCQRVMVRKKIKVALISTGDELVDISETPAVGKIRDVNSYSLYALLTEMGCEVEPFGIVKDSYEHYLACLTQAAAACQMVVISGGSSVGTKDFTIPAIQALPGPGVILHGLAVKPGKPTIFGMTGAVPLFGLPGHPVAAFMICSRLVARAVARLNGMQPAGKHAAGWTAVLTRNIASAPGRDDFVNVRLVPQANGYAAEPILGKSGLLAVLLQSDGVVHIPAGKSGLYKGETVLVQTMTADAEGSGCDLEEK